MYRIDNATSVTPIPAVGAVGPNPNSFFFKGNPAGGIPATIVDDDFLNTMQEELCNVVLAAGIALDKTNRAQLLAALQFMSGAGRNALADTGAVNAYAVAPAPAITAYANGQKFSFVPAHASTSSAPTLAVSGLGTKIICHPDGTVLESGDIPTGGVVEVVYSTAIGKFVLLTLSQASVWSGSTAFRVPGTKFVLMIGTYSIALSVPSGVAGCLTGNASITFPSTFGGSALKLFTSSLTDTSGFVSCSNNVINSTSTATIYATSNTTNPNATGNYLVIGTSS